MKFKELSEIEWAYIAGFFDGEGSIFIQHKKTSRGYTDYQLSVSVTNTDFLIIQWIKDNLGGNINFTARKHNGLKDRYAWRISGRNAIPFIERIFPYLRIKKERAKLAIEYKSSFTLQGKRLTSEAINKREEIKQKMSFLNKRGFVEGQQNHSHIVVVTGQLDIPFASA